MSESDPPTRFKLIEFGDVVLDDRSPYLVKGLIPSDGLTVARVRKHQPTRSRSGLGSFSSFTGVTEAGINSCNRPHAFTRRRRALAWLAEVERPL